MKGKMKGNEERKIKYNKTKINNKMIFKKVNF